MKIKPTIPKGMRDFGPNEVFKRQYIINKIKQTFEKFGFLPLETPTMENLSVLTGKYGDEGDQLLFKVLDSGDFLKKSKKAIISEEQFAFVNLHIYEILYNIFETLTSPENSLTFEEYLKEKKYYQFSSTSSYILDKELLNIIDDYLFKNKRKIIPHINTIKNILQAQEKPDPNRFHFHFQQFFKSHFLFEQNTKLYADLLILIKNKGYKLLGEYTPKEFALEIAEKGLRYDLTIPFARYVVMNQNDIAFPFKRYQIQPVWRADRPQKGRYREFYQCDADVIGTDSLLPEAEIIMMIQEVFEKLSIEDYSIKVNSRKILQGIAKAKKIEDKFVDLTVAIDKLDKIGPKKVEMELINSGISVEVSGATASFLHTVSNQSSNEDKFNETIKFSGSNETVQQGIDSEVKTVFEFVKNLGGDLSKVEFDPTLARGLNYYTGCIFEVVVNNVAIGSVSGGGRYDDLTSGFGLDNVSGVGFSFGLDRIYDVMTELDLFPNEVVTSTEVIIIPFDEDSFNYSLSILQKLRESNIKSELYPDVVKMKKSMKYANDKNLPYVILVGSNEMESGELSFKNMASGEQQNLKIEDIIKSLTANI